MADVVLRNMKRLARLALALVGLGTASGVAAFGRASPSEWTNDPRNYAVAWMVAPDTQVPLDAMWVGPHKSFASARLLPATLLVLKDDVAAPDGALILPAGTKLNGLVSKTKAACTLEAPPSKGLAAVWFYGADRYLCFIDDDADGRFDRYFRRAAATAGILIGVGRFPKKLVAMQPVAYKTEDPGSIVDAPRIYVQYGWFASFVDKLVFQTCLIRDSNDQACLYPTNDVKRTALPGTFEALGARFQVEEKVDNRVRVRMLTQFVSQPLVIY